jgi:hypothetical protein
VLTQIGQKTSNVKTIDWQGRISVPVNNAVKKLKADDRQAVSYLMSAVTV